MVWLSGSALVLISGVNLRLARLVLGWVTVSGFNSRWRTFISVCNQPPKANSAFHLSGFGKWVPALAGKAKAGMVQVHSVSGWTRGVQVKLWDPLRTCAIPERPRGVFTTRRYTNPRLPLPSRTTIAPNVQSDNKIVSEFLYFIFYILFYFDCILCYISIVCMYVWYVYIKRSINQSIKIAIWLMEEEGFNFRRRSPTGNHRQTLLNVCTSLLAYVRWKTTV